MELSESRITLYTGSAPGVWDFSNPDNSLSEDGPAGIHFNRTQPFRAFRV